MRNLSIKQQMPIMQRICDMFGVIITIVCDMPEETEALAYMSDNMIVISDRLRTRDSLVSTVMHEICHILAARQGKYKTFHCKPSEDYTAKDVQAIRKTAVNAETYVDVWAERLTKMYFPEVVYEQSYRTKGDKEWKKTRINKWADDFMEYLGVG